MKKTITSFLSPLLAAVFTLSAVFTGITLTADAAGLLVTTENDSGAGSLRHALGYAQAGDIITFASNVITITLASALEVDTSLTIDGGAVTLELSNTGYRHIDADSSVDSFAMIGVTLTGLYTGAGSEGEGVDNGGIHAACPVTLTGCVIRNCYKTGTNGYNGAALYSESRATLTGCRFEDNRAQGFGGAAEGGPDAGIINIAAKDCVFTGNSAQYGAAVDTDGSVELSGCTLSGNAVTANGDGSGGALYAGNAATLTGCTVSDNTANDDSNGSGGAGGGICAGAADLTNCTISGNAANTAGGGIEAGTLTLTNCTVSGNTADAGGGIDAPSITLRGSAVAGNYCSADGAANEINIYDVNNGTDTVYNGDGTLTAAGADVFADSAYYVLGVPEAGGLASLMDTVTATIGGATCDVGNLTDNGGTTQTILPARGGILIDAIPSAAFSGWFAAPAAAPSTDQRGFDRISGTGVDIGAVELRNAAAPVIDQQPTDLTLAVGQTDTALTVIAHAVDGGVLSYQWYSNTSATATGGRAVDGATGAAFTPPTAAAGIAYYYVVVTNTLEGSTASMMSDIVKVSVEEGPTQTDVTVRFVYLWAALAAGLVLAGTVAVRRRMTGR